MSLSGDSVPQRQSNRLRSSWLMYALLILTVLVRPHSSQSRGRTSKVTRRGHALHSDYIDHEIRGVSDYVPLIATTLEAAKGLEIY